MADTDELENVLEHLSKRINPGDWRVINNPTRQSDPEADEMKRLIQTIRGDNEYQASTKMKRRTRQGCVAAIGSEIN